MLRVLERADRFLSGRLDLGPRLLLLASALLIIPTYFVPLWRMTFFAPQYPEGLRLAIYSSKLQGGNGGQDIKEVNLLNHYIGMKELDTSTFPEFQWIPFVVGGLGLLFLRAMVQGRMRDLVDAAVVFVYFGLFSLWSFAHQLWEAGHDLAPGAAVKVEGFMPPVFGGKQIANFEVYSYPGPASYLLGAVAVVLLAAVALAWRQGRDVRPA